MSDVAVGVVTGFGPRATASGSRRCSAIWRRRRPAPPHRPDSCSRLPRGSRLAALRRRAAASRGPRGGPITEECRRGRCAPPCAPRFPAGARGSSLSINKRKILQSAQKHLQKGALDKALKDYQTLLEADPKDVNLRLKVGDLYLRLNKNDEAVTAYLKVADRFMKDGFDAKAVALYKQITRIDTKRVDVYVPLAELYQRLGLTSDAMGALQTAADAHYRDGNKPAALELLRKMATLDPTQHDEPPEGRRAAAPGGHARRGARRVRGGRRRARAPGRGRGPRERARRRWSSSTPTAHERVEGLGRCLLALQQVEPGRARSRSASSSAAASRNVEGYEILAEACQGLRREDELPEIYRSMVAGAPRARRRGPRARDRPALHLRRRRPRRRARRWCSGGAISTPRSAARGMTFGEAPLEEAAFISDASGRPRRPRTSRERRRSAMAMGAARRPRARPSRRRRSRRDSTRAEAGGRRPGRPTTRRGAPSSSRTRRPPPTREQLLAEATVYLRYGKHERAIESLRALLAPRARSTGAPSRSSARPAPRRGRSSSADRGLAPRRGARPRPKATAQAIEALRTHGAEVRPVRRPRRSAGRAEGREGAAKARARARAAGSRTTVLEIEIDELDAQRARLAGRLERRALLRHRRSAGGEEIAVEAELSFRDAEWTDARPTRARRRLERRQRRASSATATASMVRDAVDMTDAFPPPPPTAKACRRPSRRRRRSRRPSPRRRKPTRRDAEGERARVRDRRRRQPTPTMLAGSVSDAEAADGADAEARGRGAPSCRALRRHLDDAAGSARRDSRRPSVFLGQGMLDEAEDGVPPAPRERAGPPEGAAAPRRGRGRARRGAEAEEGRAADAGRGTSRTARAPVERQVAAPAAKAVGREARAPRRPSRRRLRSRSAATDRRPGDAGEHGARRRAAAGPGAVDLAAEETAPLCRRPRPPRPATSISPPSSRLRRARLAAAGPGAAAARRRRASARSSPPSRRASRSSSARRTTRRASTSASPTRRWASSTTRSASSASRSRARTTSSSAST